jgi:hypothetical protein
MLQSLAYAFGGLGVLCFVVGTVMVGSSRR